MENAAGKDDTMAKDAWLAETRRLLGVEWEAENDLAVDALDATPWKRLERMGKCVASLQVESFKTGLYGRTIATFQSHGKAKVLAGAGLSVGDVVRVVPNAGPPPRKLASGSKSSAGSKAALEPPSGIVSRVTELAVEVAFDERSEDQALEELRDLAPLRIDKLPNDASHRKQLKALTALESVSPADPAYHTSEVLFGSAEPVQHASLPNGTSELQPFNTGLNAPQRESIEFALRSRDVALIHGPPGTGKTTAVVELVRQAVQVFGLRVLVCAPSNVAVDNLILRLAPYSAASKRAAKGKGSGPASGPGPGGDLAAMRMVRIGHPARLLPQVVGHSLDALVRDADGAQVVTDVRNDLQATVQKLTRGGGPAGASRKAGGKPRERVNYRELRAEARTLRTELRSRERQLVQQVVKGSNVVLATNAGAAGIPKLMGLKPGERTPEELIFDLVVIDEAAQAVEASCWIPILQGRRVVLAGDHKQLPPTIKSDEAARGVLGRTLFDRVVSMYGNLVVRMLSIQYRMHSLINDWASHEMYDDKLVADPSVASRRLADLEHVRADSSSNQVPAEGSTAEGESDEDRPEFATLLMIDTAFCGMEETEEGADDELPEGALADPQRQAAGSRFNEGEARLVAKHLKELLAIGLEQHEIAVITPYNAQVHLLRSMLGAEYPQLEIRSVDGFQGREKEAVVLSLVRSNANGVVGFLADDRRLNVAITRAKRHVCVVCDSETLSSRRDSFLARMVDYFHDHAVLLSAETYDLGAGPRARFGVSNGAGAGGPRLPGRGGPHKTTRETKADKAGPGTREWVEPLSDERTSELLSMIEAFLAEESAPQFVFPATLTAGERRAVHELAEDLGIGDGSFGTDSARRVRVFRHGMAAGRSSLPTSPALAGGAPAAAAPGAPDLRKVFQGSSVAPQEGPRGEAANVAVQNIADCVVTTAHDEGSEANQAGGVAAGGNAEIAPGDDGTEVATNDAAEAAAKDATEDAAKDAAKDATEDAAKVGQDTSADADQAVDSGASAPESQPPAPPSPPSKPLTELEKIRLMHAERYAAKKEAEAKAWTAAGAATKRPQKPSGKSKNGKKGKKCGGGTKQDQGAAPGKVGDSAKKLGRDFGDDDDALLASLLATKKFCASQGCKESVLTHGVACEHCKLRYCFKHMQAEVHGCGAHARADARRAGKAEARAGPKPKALLSHHRAHLQRELGKKIATAAEKRERTSGKDAKE